MQCSSVLGLLALKDGAALQCVEVCPWKDWPTRCGWRLRGSRIQVVTINPGPIATVLRRE